jgi:hypothetical protein
MPVKSDSALGESTGNLGDTKAARMAGGRVRCKRPKLPPTMTPYIQALRAKTPADQASLLQ